MIREMDTAMNRPFNNRRIRSLLTRFRYPIAGLLFILFMVYIHNIEIPLLLSGFFVSIFGELIQAWSFGSLKKNKVLVDRGPYRIVRNPMYIGRFFVLFGFMVLTKNIYILSMYLMVFCLYAANRVKREEKALREYFGEAYEHYCKEVNRFLPALKRTGKGNIGYFNRDLFIKNHGHLNLILVLFIYLSIYFFVSI
jgi:hypothetical protein